MVERAVTSVNIIPNTVAVGGLIYPGIIDLNDPQGVTLRLLYWGVPNVQIVRVHCHVSNENFFCVRSTIPIGIALRNNYLAWPRITDFFMANDQYITTFFPAFNRVIWLTLRSQFGLRVITGYDQNTVEIVPNVFNIFSIPVRGLRNIYFNTVRSINEHSS